VAMRPARWLSRFGVKQWRAEFLFYIPDKNEDVRMHGPSNQSVHWWQTTCAHQLEFGIEDDFLVPAIADNQPPVVAVAAD
jgi:hypothetical protein